MLKKCNYWKDGCPDKTLNENIYIKACVWFIEAVAFVKMIIAM